MLLFIIGLDWIVLFVIEDCGGFSGCGGGGGGGGVEIGNVLVVISSILLLEEVCCELALFKIFKNSSNSIDPFSSKYFI